ANLAHAAADSAIAAAPQHIADDVLQFTDCDILQRLDIQKMRFRYDELIFVDRSGYLVSQTHRAVIEGGVERAPVSHLRDRPDRVGILGHHTTLLRAASAYCVAIEHTVDAFPAGSICIERADLFNLVDDNGFEQVVFA